MRYLKRIPSLPALIRPVPPDEVLPGIAGEAALQFLPSLELNAWAQAAFLSESGPFFDERNAHLQDASIAWLWAAEPTTRQGQIVVGTAELAAPPPSLSGWRKARFDWQFRQWFGDEPYDFLITLCAPFLAAADDASFCATVLHEICHCGQQVDEFGNPKFSRITGLPLYRIVGHDVEEHVAVVEWFGAGAAAGKTRQLVEAANRPPRAGRASLVGACGTCLRRAA